MKKLFMCAVSYIPAVICMALIFYFSAQNAEESSALSNSVVGAAYGAEHIGEQNVTILVRKAAHFIEYALLGALIYQGNKRNFTGAGRVKLISFSTGAGALYAISDEIHQYFVPGRACLVSDVLIDSAGVLFGAYLMSIVFIAAGKRR